MVKSVIDGVTTYYVGGYYELQVEDSVETEVKYYYAASRRIAMRTVTNSTDTLYWLISDHLSSTTIITNESGTIVSEMKYTAFGEIRDINGTSPTDYLYTGQRKEIEFGLSYYVARWYDASTGHFISADTLIPQPGNSGAWDRYAYVLNNPMKYIDPSGHRIETPDDDIPLIDGEWGIKRKYKPPSRHYLGNKTEGEIASFELRQGKYNYCAQCAVAEVFNIELGISLDCDDLGKLADIFTIKYPGNYRTFANGPTFPFQNKRFIQGFVNMFKGDFPKSFSLTVEQRKLSKENWVELLSEPNTYALVTFAWTGSIDMYRGGDARRQRAKPIAGHTMLFGAYDETKIADNGSRTPWGFVNSWQEKEKTSTSMWWMSSDTLDNILIFDTLVIKFSYP